MEVNADFTGLEVPDEWVVGYGFDYAQRNRNLPLLERCRLMVNFSLYIVTVVYVLYLLYLSDG